jgi:hypothetical protein
VSEHNTAIRMAQKLLRTRAASMPQEEIGYKQMSKARDAYAYERAASELEALILEDAPARGSVHNG